MLSRVLGRVGRTQGRFGVEVAYGLRYASRPAGPLSYAAPADDPGRDDPLLQVEGREPEAELALSPGWYEAIANSIIAEEKVLWGRLEAVDSPHLCILVDRLAARGVTKKEVFDFVEGRVEMDSLPSFALESLVWGFAATGHGSTAFWKAVGARCDALKSDLKEKESKNIRKALETAEALEFASSFAS